MSIVIVAIIAGATVLVVHAVKQRNLENQVKTELVKQNKLMKAAANNGIFSPVLPIDVKTTDKVTIRATVSASGLTYCIDGTNKTDTKIIFHMDKSTPEDTPAKGSCSDMATVAPSVPSDVAVSSVGVGTVSLTWNQSPYAASYVAQCARDASFISGLKSQSASGTATTVSRLDPGAQYYCRIAASNTKGQSEWSVAVAALTDSASVTPEDMKVATVSSSSLNYSWSPVSGATAYLLEYSTDVSFATNTTQLTTQATSGTLTGLEADTAYYFHVKAVTAGPDSSHNAFSGMVLGRTAE